MRNNVALTILEEILLRNKITPTICDEIILRNLIAQHYYPDDLRRNFIAQLNCAIKLPNFLMLFKIEELGSNKKDSVRNQGLGKNHGHRPHKS